MKYSQIAKANSDTKPCELSHRVLPRSGTTMRRVGQIHEGTDVWACAYGCGRHTAVPVIDYHLPRIIRAADAAKEFRSKYG